MRKILLSSCVLAGSIIFQACNKEEIAPPTESPKAANLSSAKVEIDKKNNEQIKFAKILAKALKHEPFLRTFLKKEGLKQFDKDYDVLYQAVKNEQVGNGETVHQLLLRYAQSEAVLQSIEDEVPLLTIYIPVLPNFSAENWDAVAQIPKVAVSKRGDNNVPSYDDSGEEKIISPDLIPGFPILVIKENERVIVDNNTYSNSSRRLAGEGAPVYHKNNKFTFSFLDKEFNGLDKTVSTASARSGATNGAVDFFGPQTDPINIAAYDSRVEWQRDNIYYGLTPTNPKGAFRNNVSEFLVTMGFLDGSVMYSKVADQTEDPRFYVINGPTPAWTEGSLEMRVTLVCNSKNGIGSEIVKILTAKPTDLFTPTYTKTGDYYKLTAVSGNKWACNKELLPWDLQNYGTAWKFIFYEHDVAQEITQTYENTTTYATNFEYNDIKVGYKFGASASYVSKNTFSIKTTLSSDYLGETVLTFDQPVITSVVPFAPYGRYWTTREVDTGILTISVEPRKMW